MILAPFCYLLCEKRCALAGARLWRCKSPLLRVDFCDLFPSVSQEFANALITGAHAIFGKERRDGEEGRTELMVLHELFELTYLLLGGGVHSGAIVFRPSHSFSPPFRVRFALMCAGVQIKVSS